MPDYILCGCSKEFFLDESNSIPLQWILSIATSQSYFSS